MLFEFLFFDLARCLFKAMRLGPRPRAPKTLSEVRRSPQGTALRLPENPQAEIWRLREAGLPEAADLLVDSIDAAERALGPGIFRGGPFAPSEFFSHR